MTTYASSAASPTPPAEAGEGSAWLSRFRDGDQRVLEQVYHRHFATVARAAGVVRGRADRETVIHELFLRLQRDAQLRASYRGDGLGAWLEGITADQARDFLGRHLRAPPPRAGESSGATPDFQALVERFQREVLPPGLAGVFEARFLRQQGRAQAASALGISWVTLFYRELRVRRLLRRFISSPGAPSS